mmetsp:Transcript_1432/g.3909  ORF Transcript_1432/g.3909 Transcript_1432/m.3909 type:complete len:166 (+) Transcript_1432:67-564(+)
MKAVLSFLFVMLVATNAVIVSPAKKTEAEQAKAASTTAKPQAVSTSAAADVKVASTTAAPQAAHSEVLSKPAYDKKDATALHAKKPKELLPIGEGAYQSAEAVKQRTKDTNTDCESSKWNDCYYKEAGDMLDGHKYGNMGAHRSSDAPGAFTGLAFLLSFVALLI